MSLGRRPISRRVRRHVAMGLRTLGGGLALGLLVTAGTATDPAQAQTSVAPVLGCPGSMVLDDAGGQCRTPRTQTALRPSSCPSGWTKVAGEYGGHECQRRRAHEVDTGRTRRVYSHSTVENVWIATGTKRVQTGTDRVWVPPRQMVVPLVPPVKVQVGTRTESRIVTRPGPDVLYRVSYQVEIRTQREVRRCAYDPLAGWQCWNETVTETRTETRTRLECCIPGPPITKTVTIEVPLYELQTARTVTVPGYWREHAVYEDVETGYWDRVEIIHYRYEAIYETVVDWVTRPVTSGPCAAGWRSVGRQCQRTVLGSPTSAPKQQCPAGTAPRLGETSGGLTPAIVSCLSAVPGSGIDSGVDQEDSGGSEDSPDATARPLQHLAGESDERLAELGIHRCANGLLSYVPCDELPGRSWDSDPGICEGIDGTTYRPDHGGTCVTESDLLNKCTTPGDCEETTIRTYCPAIGELADTQIQEHAHPDRGAETYRVCVFDCSSFGTLPPYVQTRINGSYDYACLPTDDPDSDDTEDDESEDDESEDDESEDDESEDDEGEDDESEDDESEDDKDSEDDESGEDENDDGDDGRNDDEVQPPTGITVPPDDPCASVPSANAATSALRGLTWRSHVGDASHGPSPQQDLPGGGRYLQVAPGRGWAEVDGSVDVSEHGCEWVATWVRVSWAHQRPWDDAERRTMDAGADTRHLVKRWDALSKEQKQLVSQWHRPGAVPAETVCSVGDASGPDAPVSCGWLLTRPAAYAWQAGICFEPETPSPTPRLGQQDRSRPAADDPCWVRLDSGVHWIHSVGDYADGRVTFARSGVQP